MSGFLYKYTSNESGDVVYIGQSRDEHTLINRLYMHERDKWGHDCTVECARVPDQVDLTKAETAAINYYYTKGFLKNVRQLGKYSKTESAEILAGMNITWEPIDYHNLLKLNMVNTPEIGGVVARLDHGFLMELYIITQVIYTANGKMFKLYSPNMKREQTTVTYAALMDYTNYHLYTPDLFKELSKRMKWDDVDN